MKKEIILLYVMVVASLLVACSAISSGKRPSDTQVFPTATNHFLLQGNAPIGTLDAPVALLSAPTIASVFRTNSNPSATPSPAATATVLPESTATELPVPQLFTVKVYEDSLNPNWEAQQDTKMKFDLKYSSEVYLGKAAISFTPRKGSNATLFITVSEQTKEVYKRDQVAKLSFWLYSPKVPLYLDQLFITLTGSNRLPYWNAEDQKVANYLSVFPQIRLDELGFDRAIPADTWVMVKMDLDKTLALAPEYQYLTGISFKNATDPVHTLLIDDISLTLIGKPPKRLPLSITPRVDSQ